MNIRKAVISDISVIQQIAEKSWWANYPGIISDEQIAYMLEKMYSEKALQEHFQNTNYHYYIISDEEKIPQGILGFEFDFEKNTTKLHRIYLLKESKGKGYGKLGIDFLKSEVKNFGNSRIILNVNKENKAKLFYDSQGFSVYQEIVLDIGDGFVMDDFLMEFIL